jgi:hypothetical protein
MVRRRVAPKSIRLPYGEKGLDSILRRLHFLQDLLKEGKKSSLPFRLKRAFFLTYLRALNLFLTLGRLTAKIGLVIDEMKNLSKTDG